MLESNFEGHDEPSQIAAYLSDCAQRFLQQQQPQVVPALRCLYAAAGLVLPAQFEAEIRLQLGNLLLDHTQNSQEALNQLQKAHHLALSSSGAIKFDDKCRMTRSLIDALNRTEALNLAQSILEDITIEALSMGSDSGWNWFVHFALMGLQLKFERGALPQVLVDLDRLLQLIGNQEQMTSLVKATKVIFLCFLNVILATDRKIMSVFMTLPKALQELRLALNELKEAGEIGAVVLGEFTFVLQSIPFSVDVSSSLLRIEQLLRGQNDDEFLQLPGYLQFLCVSDAKLVSNLLRVLSSRQLGTSFADIQSAISSLFIELKQSNSSLSDTLEMILSGFKMGLELESGSIAQVANISRPGADANFARKFRDFILSFTAHAVIGKLGIDKVVGFYDKKLSSSTDVDLSCLLHLNKLFVKKSTEEFGVALSGAIQNLQIPQLQLFFLILRVVEMKNNRVAAHHIRDVLISARALVSQSSCEPMLTCWLDLLQAEYFEQIDHDLALKHYQDAYSKAKVLLGHPRLARLAVMKLSNLHQILGDDASAQYWNSQLL